MATVSSMYDSSCNGTWILSKDIYEMQTFEPTNYYQNTNIVTYLNETYSNLIENDIRSTIKEVKIPYVIKNSIIGTGANGLSTKIFLLSAGELGWTSANKLS